MKTPCTTAQLDAAYNNHKMLETEFNTCVLAYYEGSVPEACVLSQDDVLQLIKDAECGLHCVHFEVSDSKKSETPTATLSLVSDYFNTDTLKYILSPPAEKIHSIYSAALLQSICNSFPGADFQFFKALKDGNKSIFIKVKTPTATGYFDYNDNGPI